MAGAGFVKGVVSSGEESFFLLFRALCHEYACRLLICRI